MLSSFAVFGGGSKEEPKPEAPAAKTTAGLPASPLRPWVYNTVQDYESATGATITEFSEAPMLSAMVSSGKYGGTIHYTEIEALPGWYVPAYWLEEPPVQLTPDGKSTYPNWMKSVEQSADDRTVEAWVLKDLTTTHSVFERNPYYWKVDIAGNQLPYTDRLEVKTATNKESLMIDAVGGDTDFLLWTITLEHFPVLKQNEATGNYTLRTWTKFAGAAVVYFMYLAFTGPGLRDILRDVRFRRALSLAINREEINNLLFFGKATPIQAAVPAGMPEEMIRFFELQDEFRSAEAEGEKIRIASEIGDIWAEQLWVIGTVDGNVPHPCLVSNELKNVAKVGLVTYFTFNHMVHIPAQYYLEK